MNSRYLRTFAVVGASMLAGCAGSAINQDKNPDIAKSDGYYVSQDEAQARGGVGNYVQVPSNTDYSRQTSNKTFSRNVRPAEKFASNQTIPTLRNHADIVFFDTGDASIGPRHLRELNRIASELKDTPDARVRIDGYSDSTGDSQQNLDLSTRRAQSVKDYLCQQGASSDQVQIVSHGENYAQGPDGNREDRKAIISLTG